MEGQEDHPAAGGRVAGRPGSGLHGKIATERPTAPVMVKGYFHLNDKQGRVNAGITELRINDVTEGRFMRG